MTLCGFYFLNVLQVTETQADYIANEEDTETNAPAGNFSIFVNFEIQSLHYLLCKYCMPRLEVL